jgi:hypothetical protein
MLLPRLGLLGALLLLWHTWCLVHEGWHPGCWQHEVTENADTLQRKHADTAAVHDHCSCTVGMTSGHALWDNTLLRLQEPLLS